MRKRIISVILVLAIILSVCIIPAYAKSYNIECDRPVVIISGDAEAIVDKDGNQIFKISNFKSLLSRWQDENGDVDTGKILDDIKYVFVPYYLEGCILGPFGNYDKYYDRIYEILSSCFGDVLLDKNGNPQNGTDISQSRREQVKNNLSKNHDTYHVEDYQFYYDWRLDPVEMADDLNEHIKQVKATTGYDKVSVICRCLGANVFFAYVAKYGMADIYGVGMDGVVVNGSELTGEVICGRFDLDINAINRLVLDLDATGKVNISDTVKEILDAVCETGIVEPIWKYVKTMHYNTVVKGLTSAMALGTFYTFPSYWCSVRAEDYETAKEYVFGSEGSEKRQEWAGLIEKLDNYDKLVRQHIPEILEEIEENANLCIISKYGMQLAPIYEDNELVGDQIISVKYSSFGATTGTIKEPLSDSYIAKRAAEGKSRYISPDKQIDASTCAYPDKTWFVKGSSHSDWSLPEMKILCGVICAEEQLTVDTLDGFTRFTVIEYNDNNEPIIWYPMTEENCHCENWEIKDYETETGAAAKLKHFGNGLKRIFALINK